MKSSKKTLALITLLSMVILIPSTLVNARRDHEILITCPDPPSVNKYDVYPMPNGFLKVDIELEFNWYYEGVKVGAAIQYVIGIMRPDDNLAMLRGYGVYTSSVDGLPGTLTYTIGNNWDMYTNEIWAFRMRIVGGTGSFEGIKGTGTDEAYPNFLLYLNFNPWE